MSTRTQILVAIVVFGLVVQTATAQQRVTRGLVTLYDFNDDSDVIRDRVGGGLDLRITNQNHRSDRK